MVVNPMSITAAEASVTVTGTGFGDYANVTILLDGDEVATGNTDAGGSFSVSFTAPDEIRLRSNSSSYIEVEDDAGNSARVSVTIADVMPETSSVVTPTPTQTTPTQLEPTTTPPRQHDDPAEHLPAPLAFIAGLGMPDWALYLVSALALVVAVLIGFLLGRKGRTAWPT